MTLHTVPWLQKNIIRISVILETSGRATTSASNLVYKLLEISSVLCLSIYAFHKKSPVQQNLRICYTANVSLCVPSTKPMTHAQSGSEKTYISLIQLVVLLQSPRLVHNSCKSYLEPSKRPEPSNTALRTLQAKGARALPYYTTPTSKLQKQRQEQQAPCINALHARPAALPWEKSTEKNPISFLGQLSHRQRTLPFFCGTHPTAGDCNPRSQSQWGYI